MSNAFYQNDYELNFPNEEQNIANISQTKPKNLVKFRFGLRKLQFYGSHAYPNAPIIDAITGLQTGHLVGSSQEFTYFKVKNSSSKSNTPFLYFSSIGEYQRALDVNLNENFVEFINNRKFFVEKKIQNEKEIFIKN